MNKIFHILTPLIAGLIFGAGLGLSGMTNPQKVINFLDISGSWDPSLAFVMAGALLVSGIAFRLSRSKSGPILGPQFHLPTRKDIDAPLVLGAALFGIGWGVLGYCPGPALANLSSLSAEPWIFVAAFIITSLITKKFQPLMFK